MFALRTLEFDRIVEVLTGLALTPLGRDALSALEPQTDPRAVALALNKTGEATAYFQSHPSFPLRAATGLDEALASLRVTGQILEPLALRVVADFLDSIERSASAIRQASGQYPLLIDVVAGTPSFAAEVAAVRRAIDPSGEVLDQASPLLRSVRDQLRNKRQRLRSTLDQFVRGKDTSKYLQEQVVTERNGRFVLIVRAEHRGNVPGIVHGSSTSGASLFLEPAATVEINNDIVELEDREREEVRRILLELSDRFRARLTDLDKAATVATELDMLQAKARFGALVNGSPPEIAVDGRLELRAARHPLLIAALRRRLDDGSADDAGDVVPIDVVVEPPTRVLLITGPNTGGKTVALKTAGLLSLMAQAGLHVPAVVARLPVFRSVFADIGDEQSIAASLSTFSAHISNIVAMERQLATPALILLDEVGTGTDPNEGGALATAIVGHFKQRGAMVIATTHYDAVKTWGTGTEGVMTAAFAFDPATFAPTYRLVYGAPGRSLAIEMAQRLGLPLAVVSSARGLLSDDQKRLAAHLARVDAQARALESERLRLQRDRRTFDEQSKALTDRERILTEREERFAKRLNEKLDDRVRQAKREIDSVISTLKDKSDALLEQQHIKGRGAGISTGDTGAARGEARDAIARIVEEMRQPAPERAGSGEAAARPIEIGTRVAVGGLGLEGVVKSIQGQQAEVDVRGKRMRAALKDLRALGGASTATAASAKVRVNVDLKPREGLLSELNVIGSTVDQAIDRVSRFLDDTLVTDVQQVRIVHGHGTGQLRKGLAAYLKDHPLVTKFYAAPREQGGDGATIVELKE